MTFDDDMRTVDVNNMVASFGTPRQLKEFISSYSSMDVRFSAYLEDLIKQKGMKRSEIYPRISFSKSQFDSLINGNKEPKNRVQVISIGIALQLTVDQMNNLLKVAGMKPLDAKRSRAGDGAVIHGLANKKDMYYIDDLLRRNGAEYTLFE